MPRLKLVELPHRFSKPPHKCIVTGRRDLPVVDFGVDYTGIDPHVYIGAGRVEEAARELLGMVPRDDVNELLKRLHEAEAENERLQELIGAAEELEQALERVKAAFEPTPDPDTGGPETTQQEA